MKPLSADTVDAIFTNRVIHNISLKQVVDDYIEVYANLYCGFVWTS